MHAKITPAEVAYVVEQDLFGTITAYWKGRVVGHLTYVDQVNGERLLADVMVKEVVVISSGRWAALVRKLFPRWGVVSCSCSGIGTELMKRFLILCQHDGTEEVFGNVTPEADKSHPFLRRWYESLGFKIASSDGRAEFFTVAYKVIWNPPASG